MTYVNGELITKAEELYAECGSEAAYQFLMNILRLEVMRKPGS